MPFLNVHFTIKRKYHVGVNMVLLFIEIQRIFHIDLGDYYASYIAMKERKDRTAYLHHLMESLVKRMNEDDMK